MSDQRRIVPSETPSAWAACEVERPSGLVLICSMDSFQRGLCRVRESRTAFAQPRTAKMPFARSNATMSGEMRLRLYHHPDGARVAYRETGTGPAITLLHSLGLSHREWEPIVAPLSARFRVVLPDLPLHGDSEDRPRHPYTADWLAEVIAGFCQEVAGPASAAGRTRHRGRAGAARRHDRATRARAPGADVKPAASPRPVRGTAGTVARNDAPGRAAGTGPGSLARRQAAVPSRRRRAPLGSAQPGSTRSAPPCVRRRRRQRQPRAFVGEVRSALAVDPQRALLDDYPGDRPAGAAVVGRG